jgi:hypothetical protein
VAWELEEDEEIVALLSSLEGRLKRRIARAPLRSPETLFEELQALELVIDLERKLGP